VGQPRDQLTGGTILINQVTYTPTSREKVLCPWERINPIVQTGDLVEVGGWKDVKVEGRIREVFIHENEVFMAVDFPLGYQQHNLIPVHILRINAVTRGPEKWRRFTNKA
jgi:hypothetical protein